MPLNPTRAKQERREIGRKCRRAGPPSLDERMIYASGVVISSSAFPPDSHRDRAVIETSDQRSNREKKTQARVHEESTHRIKANPCIRRRTSIPVQRRSRSASQDRSYGDPCREVWRLTSDVEARSMGVRTILLKMCFWLFFWWSVE